ncbi:LOW QUALITY PROTEIN: hypothetical protein CRUP_011335 [Coryphaenoides rupestris]|nr:LOW QUALITY PROTEIN: hypothetical protein CRUP_011335 [Coryphaenoides rupestris]
MGNVEFMTAGGAQITSKGGPGGTGWARCRTWGCRLGLLQDLGRWLAGPAVGPGAAGLLSLLALHRQDLVGLLGLLGPGLGLLQDLGALAGPAAGPGVVNNVSELLGLDSFQLSEVLTQRSMILRGEEICSPLTVEQLFFSPPLSLTEILWVLHLTFDTRAVDSRDSVAMALYSQCFSWIIMRINQKIKGKDNFKSIGILDIFGFENFEVRVNRFEQFNINYANEKLQEYFNKHIFSLEQLEYNRVTDHQFGIKHYAGEKNRDTFRDDILFILKDSRLDFIYDLFERVGSRSGDETMKMGTARRKPTVSSQFRHANRFDPDVVLNQLRYSGMLETVKIRRAGFPVRRTFEDFYVFLKEALEQRLEKQREEERRRAGMVIRAHVLSYVARKQYQRVLSSVVTIQKNYRAHFWRRGFLRLRTATLILQKHQRGRLARALYHHGGKEEERGGGGGGGGEGEGDGDGEEAHRAAGGGEETTGRGGDRQMEEILRLEREIERLQRQQEDGVSLLGEDARDQLRQRRDAEIYRLEKEASRVAAEFLDLLDFGGLEPSLSSEENLHDATEPTSAATTAPLAEEEEEEEEVEEEEVDEGFHAAADECCVPPPPLPDFQSLPPLPPPPPPPGSEEKGPVLAPSPSNSSSTPVKVSSTPTSSSTTPRGSWHSSSVSGPGPSPAPAPPPPPVLTNGATRQPYVSGGGSTGASEAREEPTSEGAPPRGLLPQDAELDYDQDELECEEVHRSSGASTTDGPVTENEELLLLRNDEDNECYVDTDEEVSNGRVNTLNGTGPPYFHSYLYMKSGLMIPWRRRWCVLKDETFMWFRAKQDSLKSGWLYKKGGGMSTLSRRNWKMRWFVLREAKLMYFENDSEEKLKGTIDVRSAKQIVDNHEKENALNIVTDERTYHIYAETPEDASWFNVLSRVHTASPEQRMEMHHEQANPKNAVLKKRWFVLTSSSLDYYKTSERTGAKLGTLVLNSLCSIVQPDEKIFKESGYWNIIVHGRKHSYRLYTKVLNEAMRWATAIQGVIDNKVPIETPTQQLIRDIKESSLNVEAERGYSSLQDEAVKIFNSLQEMEAVSDPVPIIQGILQTCQDLRPLRDEPNSLANRAHWHLLTCMSCTFLPSRRHPAIKELFPGSEIELFAHFVGESLKKTKCREYVPSQEEIVALLTRQEMTTTVYCHGGGSCKISINSHTTAGEVVEKLIRGLAMEDSRNMFALFEHRNNIDKAVESRVIVADVLAKFERLAGSEDEEDEGQWKLYFKLYCFLDVESMPKEGAHESLTSGHFPAPEETLQHLAAMRLQFLHGDKARVGWVLENVYPMGRLRSRILHFTKAGSGGGGGAAGQAGQAGHTLERRRTSFLEGTLRRGLKTGSMKKQRMEEEQMLEMWIKEETSATRASVLEKWSRLRGLDQHQAMLKYMTVIKEWPGYGSTLFDVECKEGGFPHDLWLSVSAENISVYKRGDPKPLETFPYEHIVFFGAPQPCTYKITVDEREMFFETPQVGEITKIMKAYINMIVKKRCSVRSVSSYGTNWIR